MEFKLPDIGEGVHEGEIVKWMVKPGQSVEADEPMVEVMTDKATVEIPSPVKGTVEDILAKEGETIEVGKVIVKIAESGASAQATTAPPVEDKPAAAPAPTSAPSVARVPESKPISNPVPSNGGDVIPFKVLATPATRKLARDLDVDISAVPATGPHGRVTKMDVQMAYEGKMAASPRSSHPAPAATALSTPRATGAPLVVRGDFERVPLKGVRRAIAQAMTKSKQTAAHFTYVEEVDMSQIVKLRKSHKAEAEKRGFKLTFLPFIIKGLIPTLKEFPYLNASLDDEKQEILLKGDYNIGIATDTPQGLMVPVIKEADRKNVWELAQEIGELSEKSRTGKISIDELKGGTFTITNAGSLGGVFATPVINHPEVAILGVNAIRRRPVVKGDDIGIADMMYLSLSVDHRVVDGADAARFMNQLVFFLSDPMRFVFA